MPIKIFRTAMGINFVDNAKAATPVAPLIAAHLNFLKSSLFLVFV